jgi:hypothetical protein
MEKIILAKAKGRKILYKNHVSASRALKRAVDIPGARGRIKFIPNLSRLRLFIDDDQISEVAGGFAPVHDQAFDFC